MYQFAALVVTLGLSISGGIISAICVERIVTEKKSHGFNDEDEWEVPKSPKYE